jgi:hypothetical protein
LISRGETQHQSSRSPSLPRPRQSARCTCTPDKVRRMYIYIYIYIYHPCQRAGGQVGIGVYGSASGWASTSRACWVACWVQAGLDGGCDCDGDRDRESGRRTRRRYSCARRQGHSQRACPQLRLGRPGSQPVIVGPQFARTQYIRSRLICGHTKQRKVSAHVLTDMMRQSDRQHRGRRATPGGA